MISPPESPVGYFQITQMPTSAEDCDMSDDGFTSDASLEPEQSPDYGVPSVDCFLKDRNTVTALAYARNCDTEIHPEVSHFLEAEINKLWTVLQSSPEYVMHADEFALFNFFVYRFQDSAVIERAISAFWQNYKIN